MMRISHVFRLSPARISILGFATLILIGTLLLSLPSATVSRQIPWVDALFTATSATCVTGLVVLDTGRDLSLFGQVVVLGLIQAGGLGIMTLSTLFLLMAGKRPSLTGRIAVQDSLTQGGQKTLFSFLREVVLFTFVVEILGAVLLFWRLSPGRGFSKALYLSLFHSVSAFCNAGFSLFSDSFIRFRGDWTFNLVVCFLIILGGIGFLVLSELKRGFPYNRRRWDHLSLHSKLVLSASVMLILIGTSSIVFMEWDHALSRLSVPQRFLTGFFQSVTARTAGFNTIQMGDLANETLFFLILLMFVGASPGSCGGGVKTTTLASLLALGVSRLRGQERPQMFRRTIADASIGKAISVVMISGLVVLVGIFAVLMAEHGDLPHSMARGMFLKLFFEVVSAFGTVGLSTGMTSDLTGVGKLILTLVMFIGRLGPMVIAIAVSRSRSPQYHYAEESVMIG